MYTAVLLFFFKANLSVFDGICVHLSSSCSLLLPPHMLASACSRFSCSPPRGLHFFHSPGLEQWDGRYALRACAVVRVYGTTLNEPRPVAISNRATYFPCTSVFSAAMLVYCLHNSATIGIATVCGENKKRKLIIVTFYNNVQYSMCEMHFRRRYGEMQTANRPSLAHYNADNYLSNLC